MPGLADQNALFASAPLVGADVATTSNALGKL
jgi:hypothetical protein